jgi:cell shape-determining protein MreC
MRTERARHRRLLLLAGLLVCSSLLGWQHRAGRAVAEPSRVERFCSRLLDLAGQEAMGRASHRLRTALSRRLGGAALEREKEILAERVALHREQNDLLRDVAADSPRLPELETERDRLSRLVGAAIAAGVIGHGPGPCAGTLIINVGSANNVQPGDAVLSGPDLVGVVARANRKTSTVALLSAPSTRIRVRCTRSQAWLGTARGATGGRLKLRRLPPLSADVREGDVVCTVGRRGAMPGGIIVGIIESYHRLSPDAGGGEGYEASAIIRPLADTARVRDVRVLRVAAEGGR